MDEKVDKETRRKKGNGRQLPEENNEKRKKEKEHHEKPQQKQNTGEKQLRTGQNRSESENKKQKDMQTLTEISNVFT